MRLKPWGLLLLLLLAGAGLLQLVLRPAPGVQWWRRAPPQNPAAAAARDDGGGGGGGGASCGPGPGAGRSVVFAGLCRNAVKHDDGERLPHLLAQVAAMACDPLFGEVHVVILESNSLDATREVLGRELRRLELLAQEEEREHVPRKQRLSCFTSVQLPPDAPAPAVSARHSSSGSPGSPTPPPSHRLSRITKVRRTLHRFLRAHFMSSANGCGGGGSGGGAPAGAGAHDDDVLAGGAAAGGDPVRVRVDHVVLVDFDVFGLDTGGLLNTLRRLERPPGAPGKASPPSPPHADAEHGGRPSLPHDQVLCAYSLDAANWYRDTFATVHEDGSWSHPLTWRRDNGRGDALKLAGSSQPRKGGVLPVRSCFGGVAVYPPGPVLDGACRYQHLANLQRAPTPGRGPAAGSAQARPTGAPPPFPAAAYIDRDGRTCEHIGFHFCLSAEHRVGIGIADQLRVWYRRMDARANVL